MGLLSDQPVEVDDVSVIPMHLISKLSPPAPKYREEIQAIIDEGMEVEEGVVRVRVDGVEAGERVRRDSYVETLGLEDSFERAGISHEAYLTGQSAYLFTKMLADGRVKQTGAIPPEALDAEARAYYLAEAAKLDITVDEVVERRLY
jgi:saccharopine dehydrogenase-like NADP-dependent oxidoreductase